MINSDQVGSRVKLDGVIVKVGNEAPELPGPDATAIASQLDGVEVIAKIGQVVGDVGLEEVVVPAMEVEDRARPDPRGQTCGSALPPVRRRRARPAQAPRRATPVRSSRTRPGSQDSRWSPTHSAYLMNLTLTGYL